MRLHRLSAATFAALALAMAADPDHPAGLSKVTETT